MYCRHSQSIGEENDIKALCSLLNIKVGFGFYWVSDVPLNFVSAQYLENQWTEFIPNFVYTLTLIISRLGL